MTKYGLKRGIEGPEARHITTQEFSRDTSARSAVLEKQLEIMAIQKETLLTDIDTLQAELAQTRRKIKTDKLKGAAVDATDSYIRETDMAKKRT